MITLTSVENEYDLLKTIKFYRKEMIRIGIQEGLTSEKTINISRKLDIYITKYQSMKYQKKNPFNTIHDFLLFSPSDS